MIKIFVNGKFLTKNTTGVQRFAREIVRELLLSGTDVVLLCPEGKIQYDDIITPDCVIQIPGGHGTYWEQIALPIYLFRNQIKNLLNLCNTAPIFYSKNTIVLHDVIFKRYPDSYPPLMRWLYSLFIKGICRRARLLLTVSDFSRKEISEVFGISENIIGIIPNAVPSVFKQASSMTASQNTEIFKKIPKEFIFSVLGSFDPNKNLQGLISAFKLLKNDHARLLLLGNHAEKHPKMLSKALEDPRILYIGRVTDEQLLSYYRASWYYVIPSRLEGFGIPPLEAQCCGCPVLSSNTSSLPQVLGESAIYFNPDDINSIRDALELSISDLELRKKMILRAKENILRFDFRRSAHLLLNRMKESH